MIRNIVEAAAIRDLSEASVYDGELQHGMITFCVLFSLHGLQYLITQYANTVAFIRILKYWVQYFSISLPPN